MKVKKLKLGSFILFLSFVFFYACSQDDEGTSLLKSTDNRSQVINTYTERLAKNVDSIQEVTIQHPLISEIANQITFDYKLNSTAAIYYYSNNYEALILEDVATSTANSSYVYAYLFDSTTKELKDILYTRFSIKDSNRSANKEVSASMVSLITNTEITSYDPSKRQNWGECMSDGMDQLYNDWSNEPGGTFACWVTGYWCAVGGAIGCTIQSW